VWELLVNFIPALGVFAGWIIVMPATVLNLALRVDEIDSGHGNTNYSLVLSAGWVSLIVSLFLMGKIGDLVFEKSGSRSTVIGFGILGSALLGFALSQANTTITLALAWCLIQFPAAALITSSLALASQHASESKQGLSSGLAGGAPVLALFIGTLVTSAAGPAPANAFLFTSILGAIFAIPLLMIRKAPVKSSASLYLNRGDLWDTANSQKFWNRFLLAAFLLSCTTSSANGFLLVFASDVLGLDSIAASDLVTTMVLVASLSSIVSGVIAGKFLISKKHVILAYSFAAILVGASIGVLILFPSEALVFVAGLIFGVGFGTANGLELTMFMKNQNDPNQAGRALGLFTSATTAPYVLIPLVAAFLLRNEGSTGITQLWLGGSVLGIAAGIIVLRSSKITS
jgi:MFS family permease